jgi:flavin-dependent dehydrogenase
MKSGMLAAETAFSALYGPSTSASAEASESAETSQSESESDTPVDMAAYEQAVKDSWIYKELTEVRNLRPSFHNPLGQSDPQGEGALDFQEQRGGLRGDQEGEVSAVRCCRVRRFEGRVSRKSGVI